MAVDRSGVEQFVYREARLIDENRYDEWLALWTNDARYWVPCGADDGDPKREVSLIYDDLTRLRVRIARLNSGVAYAQDPKSRMRRVVSNIEAAEVEDGQVMVSSNFLLAELRQGKQDLFAGRTIHHLSPYNDSFRMRFKKVLLVNNGEYIDNLTFLV